MTIQIVREAESPSSTDTSDLTNRSPSTPRLPFDPPRRRSSLAFSKIVESPRVEADVQKASTATPNVADQPHIMRSAAITNKRTESVLRHSGARPGHVSQIQKVFQLAQANLQLDMHFAASPMGSIEARLPKSNGLGNEMQSEQKQKYSVDKSWRYSTIPRLFSVTASDVREPLPDTSPTLPAVVLQREDVISPSEEPPSSGYASPIFGDSAFNVDNAELPPLPSSSPVHDSHDNGNDDIYLLTRPMTGLKVGNTFEDCDKQFSEDEDMDDSPVVHHLRRKSSAMGRLMEDVPGTLDGIMLSQSARAAAESAKAKRNLLKQAFDNSHNKENTGNGIEHYRQGIKKGISTGCPDPALHDHVATTPCPDPFAHIHASRADSRPQNGFYSIRPSSNMQQYNTRASIQRTTAAGSPMPFARRAFSPQPPSQDVVLSPPKRSWHLPSVNSTPYTPQHTHQLSEHFRPGWYYANGSSNNNTHTQPNANLYSFSTAAAKVTGASAAPESRIRNSYRTDTLTPLARPPGRYRKNGFARTLQSSQSHRYPINSRAFPQSKPRWLPPGPSKNQSSQNQNLQFRSSPPPASDRHKPSFKTKKRSYDDSVMPDFEIAEDESATSIHPSTALSGSDGVIEVDEDTRAAVRMSIFGTSTPECLHGAREGIRELSPNVNIWRKDLISGPYHRKKRRPSFWDGDLEEVRMSPAGRGGIASSPTISKRSMMAELESLSNRTDITGQECFRGIDTVQLFDEDQSDDVGNEVEMIELAELEA